MMEKVKSQFTQKPEKKTQSGLSLTEILIVVAVLLLILVAVFRSLGNDVNKARDAQRKKDLAEIKVAFENYYNDRNCYPPADALSQCGANNLNPYLKQIPCDPLGQNYLYLPEGNSDGATCGGYRILSKISPRDPNVELVGCPGGCGVPEGISDQAAYNYGVAEGIALNQLATFPIIEPSATMTPSATTTPTGPIIPEENCTVATPCYCCDGGGGNACNEWYFGQAGSACQQGPYQVISDCINYTICSN